MDRNYTRQLILVLMALSPQAIQAELDTQTRPLSKKDRVRCELRPGQQEPLCHESSDDSTVFVEAPPIFENSIKVDVRPENCQSFFDDYLHTRRGIRIEDALYLAPFYQQYEPTVSNFPVVDFISNGHARIVKTRDLSSHSFNQSNSSSLYDQIIEDAKDIQERLITPLRNIGHISAKANGIMTTINKKDVDVVTVDIVIQAGLATPNQIDQISAASKELKKRWGFNLQIIEIP